MDMTVMRIPILRTYCRGSGSDQEDLIVENLSILRCRSFPDTHHHPIPIGHPIADVGYQSAAPATRQSTAWTSRNQRKKGAPGWCKCGSTMYLNSQVQ